MKKFFARTSISVLLILSLLVLPVTADDDAPEFEPLSPEFLRWQEEHSNDSQLPSSKSDLPSGKTQAGYVPSPVNLSHLADNPPVEDSSPYPSRKADTLPSKYDLRNVNGKSYVTSIKDQEPYGTCWAHAALGAMESNMLMQGKGTYDLSEMHLAWFTFKGSDKSKTFKNMGSSSFTSVMDNGGNSFYPAAMFTRIDGPAYEKDVPYGEGKQPSGSDPANYTRAARLRDVYYLNFANEPNVNVSSSARDIVKRRIMETGAVVGNYYNNNTSYYVTASGGTSYYYNSSSTNHAVQIIGWDDNYSRNNFKTKPAIDGAWLIKNSWGDEWYTGDRSIGNRGDVGDNGCFWMSYAQHLTEGSAFIAEPVNDKMNAYYYDALGWCSTLGYSSSTIHAANVFKAERDETLIEVGFITPDNNTAYEINVYTGMSSMPSSSPIPSGKKAGASSSSGTIPYAGYHTVTLDNPVALSEGEYFSVVVTFTNKAKAPVEKKVLNWSNNAVIDKGSFFSPNGYSWITGESQNVNATIKAFTVGGSVSGTAPRIEDGYPPDGYLNRSYSAVIKASGTKPITWSASRKIPEGLSINSSTGEISGTPTKEGNFTFSVTAENSYGKDTKFYTMNIWHVPAADSADIVGYVGYTLKHQMAITPSVSATWSVSSGTLPTGLSLSKAGLISGNPTKAGTYSATLKAVSKLGESETDVTFTINAKPTKPVIRIAGLKTIVVGEDFSHDIEATGTEPITITIEGQPDGITLKGATAYMSGIPVNAGTFSIKITAENIATQLENKPVTKTVKLVVKARPPVINAPGELPDAIVGEAISPVQFTLSDGTEPVTWSASGMPSGLIMSRTGLLSGTPTRAGNFYITVKASNSGGNTSVRIPLTVLLKPTLSIPGTVKATTDKKFSTKLTAKGNTPITWEIDGLPDTLEFSQNESGTTATITGTPVSMDNYTVTVRVSNAAGEAEGTFKLSVAGVAPKLTASIAKAKVGEEYEETRIYATGTKPIEITCEVNTSQLAILGAESLEDLGLTFTNDPAKGTAVLRGTPTMSVKGLQLILRATSPASSVAVSKSVTFNAVGKKPAFILPDSHVSSMICAVNSPIEIAFKVTGTPNIQYTMGRLNGFELEQTGSNDAVVKGTAPARDANLTLNVTASNADGIATKRIIVKVQTPPTIIASTAGNSDSSRAIPLPDGILNRTYSMRLSASGTKSIRWTIDGDLPDGMKFSNGLFSGKPKEAGSFTFTVTASNNVGEDVKELTLTIYDPNADKGSIPEAEPEIVKEEASQPDSVGDALPDTQDDVDPVMTFGQTRVLAENQTELKADGYTVAALLPEISVNVSGMYDLEAEIPENIPEGAVLYWLPCPDDDGSEDDAIAEFYDEAGAEITTVPAGRKIVVSSWFRAGVKYSPVIVVK